MTTVGQRGNQVAAGRVTAVSWQAGKAFLTVSLEANTVSVSNVAALYLSPQAGDQVLLLGAGQTWTAIGLTNRSDAAVTKIGDRTVSQAVASGGAVKTCAFVAGDVPLDTHGWSNASTDRIEADIEGWYQFSGECMSTSSINNASRCALFGRVGGTAIISEDTAQGTSSPWSASFAEVVYLDGTTADYVDMGIFHTHGSDVTFTWSYSVTLIRTGAT